MKKFAIIFMILFLTSCGENNVEKTENISEKVEQEVVQKTEKTDEVSNEKVWNILKKHEFEIWDKNGQKFYQNSRGKYVFSVKNDGTLKDYFMWNGVWEEWENFHFNAIVIFFKDLGLRSAYRIDIENGNFLTQRYDSFEEFVDKKISDNRDGYLKESIDFQGLNAYKIVYRQERANDENGRDYSLIFVNLWENNYLKIQLTLPLLDKDENRTKTLQDVIDSLKIIK